MPSLVQAYPAPSSNPVIGAHMATYLDGTVRLYVGTTTKLYRGLNGGWLDYSGGQTFGANPNNRWRFAQFGDDTIAVNGFNVPQFINSTGDHFVPLAGNPPVAKVVASVFNFVFLLNLLDPAGHAAVTPTMWWCSGLGNDADWTPSLATQSANGYLDESPGEIIGAKPLGRSLVVYKQDAIHLLEYMGPPVIWGSRVLSKTTGALSHEAVVDLGDMHVFMGRDDFYVFDGAGSPQPLESPLRRFVYELGDLNWAYAWAAAGRYDRALDCVFWHYPSKRLTEQTSPPTLDAYVVWNRHQNKWLYGLMNITQVVTPEILIDLGQTYGEFGAPYAQWDDIVNVQWNSFIFFGSTNVIQGVIRPNNTLASFTGNADPDAFIECGDFGTGGEYQFIRAVRPAFSVYPSYPGTSLKLKHRVRLGDSLTEGDTVYLDENEGTFFFTANSPFTRCRFNLGASDCELTGYEIDHDGMGTE